MSSARSRANSWATSRVSPRIVARLFAVAALAALTAGCFQPMYAERSDGAPGLREKLAGVEVPPLAYPSASPQARVGVAIRNALMFKMYGSATGLPPTYRLMLRFNPSRTSLIVDPNTALPTSENYGIDATYGLIEIATGINSAHAPLLAELRGMRDTLIAACDLLNIGIAGGKTWALE